AGLLKNNLDTWVEVARGHLRLKNWDEASAALDRALGLVPPPGQGGLNALGVYSSLPLFPEAFQELSRRRPDDGRLWLVHGRQLASARRWAEAASAFEKAAALMKNA